MSKAALTGHEEAKEEVKQKQSLWNLPDLVMVSHVTKNTTAAILVSFTFSC